MIRHSLGKNKEVLQAERRRRIATAQDEELNWRKLKKNVLGEADKLICRAARDARKTAGRFILTNANGLYSMRASLQNRKDVQEELRLRLVVPAIMIQAVLQNSHVSLEGGHKGVTFEPANADHKFSGYSPDNIQAEKPFRIVFMTFVIPLPKLRQGNTTLLLFQSAFIGFGITKPMSDTTALRLAQAFEEYVYRKFQAPSFIPHYRDPRFMIEISRDFELVATSKWTTRKVCQDSDAIGQGICRRSISARLGRNPQSHSVHHQYLYGYNKKLYSFIPSPWMGRTVNPEGYGNFVKTRNWGTV
ncbi:reverse transcriptase [Phytophthora megakarya]|uniref:Reverse transcriptase n=1 Tax=Phytophthora megakarya TaxID=4795 RepID=A0A225W285_9STRA|nr:reverse transcriptase [Phytophthora megakarya]